MNNNTGMKMNFQNERKNTHLEEVKEDGMINSFVHQNLNNSQANITKNLGPNSLSARATMIMNNSKKINSSKKRNMNEYMSQGILEVEKVLNESQTFQSIQDPVVQIDEAAELQKVLDMKYSEKNDETQNDF